MAWTDILPVLTDEMVAQADEEMPDADLIEYEEHFGVKQIFGARPGTGHTLSVSLFFKSTNSEDGIAAPLSEETLRNPALYGIKCRYEPWEHYIEPLLQYAPVISKKWPGVKIRVYLASDLEFLIPQLVEHCEVCLMRSSSLHSAPGMLWRFLAIEESENTTVLDADLLSLADARLHATAQLRSMGLGGWRVPVAQDFHRKVGFYYRPIAGYASGYALRLPMRKLLTAFCWHARRGTLPCYALHPLNGQKLPMFGTIWPDYGFDEFFLLAAVYPRLVQEGVLTVIPSLPKPPRSFMLPIDVEYSTWANPKSSVDIHSYLQLSAHPKRARLQTNPPDMPAEQICETGAPA